MTIVIILVMYRQESYLTSTRHQSLTVPHKEPCLEVGLKSTTLHFWVVCHLKSGTLSAEQLPQSVVRYYITDVQFLVVNLQM